MRRRIDRPRALRALAAVLLALPGPARAAFTAQVQSAPQPVAPTAAFAALSPADQLQFASHLTDLVSAAAALPSGSPALPGTALPTAPAAPSPIPVEAFLAAQIARPDAPPAQVAAGVALLSSLAHPREVLPALSVDVAHVDPEAAAALARFASDPARSGLEARSAQARTLAGLRLDLPASWSALFDGWRRGAGTAEPGAPRIRLQEADGKFREVSEAEFQSVFGVRYVPRLTPAADLPPAFTEAMRREEAARGTFEALEARFSFLDDQRAMIRSEMAREGFGGVPEPVRRWLYGRQLDQGVTADVYIAKVDDAVGYGLFAAADIRPGDLIGEYAGTLRPRRPGDGKNNYLFSFQEYYDLGVTVDASSEGNVTRFINHSARPNAAPFHVFHGGMRRIVFIANRPIARGQQILFDYGPRYWGNVQPADLR